MVLTKDFPASNRTTLKILGMLMPTAATAYVAIITLPSASAILSYSVFLSLPLVEPHTNTESGISSNKAWPAAILSTSTRVLPASLNLLIILATSFTLASFSSKYFNSLW